MAAPGGATLPLVDGSGCARGLPGRRGRLDRPAGMPHAVGYPRFTQAGRARGKGKLVRGKGVLTLAGTRRGAEARGYRAASGEQSSSRPTGSQLFALVGDRQSELRSLVAHQHAAELVLVDLLAIDDQQREAAVVGAVTLDPTTHHARIGDFESVVALPEMLD